jgi:hypothetical protein
MEGDMVRTKTKECAGFLTLVANECGEKYMPDGFEPAYDIVYNEAMDMADAYEEQEELDNQRRTTK